MQSVSNPLASPIGIIAEFNPLHNGHAQLLQTLRNKYPEPPIIIAMSGSFVQRGVPALTPAHQRANWALQAGADIVVELPSYFAVSNGEQFARGGVRLLHGLGVRHIAFGAETAEKDTLLLIAKTLHSDTFQEHVQQTMKTGISYPNACQQVLDTLLPLHSSVLRRPNALLGIEYMKAALTENFAMEWTVLPRTTHHNARFDQGPLPSGSFLREQIFAYHNGHLSRAALIATIQRTVPSYVADDLLHAVETGAYADPDRYGDQILLASRCTSLQQLASIEDMAEGLENLWKKSAHLPSWEDLREACKSKRYTYSRLQRIAANLLLGRTQVACHAAYESGPCYARLLGFSPRGQQWLRTATPHFPIVHKWGAFYQDDSLSVAAQRLAQGDTLASSLQALAMMEESHRDSDNSLVHSPIRYVPTESKS